MALTFALAFVYDSVHAAAKSGTSSGLSTGGGWFGELAGYTPGMGGSEEGEGKGTKAYGVVGITNGPGWVSTPLLEVVVVGGAEEEELEEFGKSEDESDVAPPERGKLGEDSKLGGWAGPDVGFEGRGDD
jgi:hypothetical protein